MNADICHFVQLHGAGAGQVHPFQSGRIRIGTGDQCDLQIPELYEGLPVDAAEVLLLDDGDFHLNPTQGRVPVLINGRAITRITPLRSEDYIRIGVSGPEVIFRHGHPDANLGMKVVPEYPTAQLQFLDGSLAGQRLDIKLDRLISVGRLPTMDIKLDPRVDITVSGRHCTLRWDDAGAQFIVTDCSRNGTYVDDAPVDGEALVTDGSEIRLSASGPRFYFLVRGPQRDYPNGIPSAPQDNWSEDLEDFGVAPEPYQDSGSWQPEAEEARIPTDAVAPGPDSQDMESVPFHTFQSPRVPDISDTQMPTGTGFPGMFGEPEPSSAPAILPLPDVQAAPVVKVPSDPPTDPGEATAINDPITLDPDSHETVSQPFRTDSKPSFLADPDRKRSLVNSGGTWPRQGTIGPTVEPPVSSRRPSRPSVSMIQRASRSGRLSEVPLPPGKQPAVPVRLNLLRREVGGPAGVGSSPFGGSGQGIGSGSLISSGLVWQLGGPLLVVVILIVIWAATRGSNVPDPTDPMTHAPEPGRSVALAMAKPVLIENKEGGFSAKLPSTWDNSVKDGVLQASSPGGDFAIEMVRYHGLTPEVAVKIVSQDGTPVNQAPPGERDGLVLRTFAAKSNGVSRVAVMLQKKYGASAPLLAMLEASSEHMDTMDRDVLSSIMVHGITLSDSGPTKPSFEAEKPEATPVPTPAVQASVTPTPGSSPALPTASDPNAVMALASSGITIAVPDGWTGTEDTAAGILAMESPEGLDIRVTATDWLAPSEAVFSALVSDGWIEVSRRSEKGLSFGHFRLGREHIAVLLVPRNALPAGVIYAHSSGPLTEAQLQYLLVLGAQVARQP